jgi:hypothetical protein
MLKKYSISTIVFLELLVSIIGYNKNKTICLASVIFNNKNNSINLPSKLKNTNDIIKFLKTPDDFLKEVQEKYHEDYQKDPHQVNLKCWNKFREAHINQVIKIYYAFINEDFEYIYNTMSEKRKAKINKNDYIKKLQEIKQLYYDTLDINDKISLEIATIFHDRGYAISDDVLDHDYSGGKFIIEYLKKNQTKFGNVNIDDIAFIIKHHGSYAVLGMSVFLDEWQKIIQNPKYKKYIFLIYLFDNMGKVDRDDYTKPDNSFDMELLDKCEKAEKINNEESFLRLRFRNFFSLPIAILEINEKYKDLFEQKLNEFNIDKKFWTQNVNIMSFCLISDLLKLPYTSENEKEKMCERMAKFICIIERIAKTQNNKNVKITDNIHLLLMQDGLLIKRRIYYETFIKMLDELTINDIKTMPIINNNNEIKLDKFEFEIKDDKLIFNMKNLPNIYSLSLAIMHTLQGLMIDNEFNTKVKIFYANLCESKLTLTSSLSKIIDFYLKILKPDNNEIKKQDILKLYSINTAV